MWPARAPIGGVNWMTSARQGECPPTLNEGADMAKKPKAAGRTRKAPKTAARDARPAAARSGRTRLPFPPGDGVAEG